MAEARGFDFDCAERHCSYTPRECRPRGTPEVGPKNWTTTKGGNEESHRPIRYLTS